MIVNGRCKHWNKPRGFGFITSDDGTDIFTHCSYLMLDRDYLEPGELVTFETEHSSRGVRAINVEVVTG